MDGQIDNIHVQRGSQISLSWFSCRSFILVVLKFGGVAFCGGRKTRHPGEKPLEQGEKLNPDMAASQ